MFITGGGSGIGESVVEHFAAQGANVCFVDIAEMHRAPSWTGAQGRTHSTAFHQMRHPGHRRPAAGGGGGGRAERTCARAGEQCGNDDRHTTESVTVDYWDNRMQVNLRHQFFAAQAVRPQMRDAGGGSIINFGSITWLVGDPDCPAYVTAKSAIGGLTRALARELGPEKIRVNCVLPGWVMTERQVRLWLNEAGERQIAERQCLTEKLYPPDIARMVLFLAADDSRMCTSQNFIVDGGWV